MADELYNIIKKDIEMVNKELKQRKVRFPDHKTTLAQQAQWAAALKHRLDELMEVNYLEYFNLFILIHYNTSMTHFFLFFTFFVSSPFCTADSDCLLFAWVTHSWASSRHL